MAAADADQVGALAAALGRLLGRAGAGFDELVTSAPLTEERRRHLMAREPDALDELVAELNERRRL